MGSAAGLEARAAAFAASRVAQVLVPLWCVAWGLWMARGGGTSWHWFSQGGHALADVDDPSAGGLHVYAAAPQLQFGPFALLVAAALSTLAPGLALSVAQVAGVLAGAVALGCLTPLSRGLRPGRPAADLDRAVRLALIPLAPVWLWMTVRVVHIDDALALMFVVLA